MKRVALALAPMFIGWVAGAGVALLSSASPAAAGVCDVEPAIDFSNGPQTIRDTDDGQDEENQWWFHGGNDFGRSLACDDGDVHGQDDFDDVGGGSGRDFVTGGLNADEVFGGVDSDDLRGDAGDDVLEDVETDDFDAVRGGDNADEIEVRDGDPDDAAYGNAGQDICRTNAGDLEDDSCEG